MVVHIISVALTAFYLYAANPGSDLFSWHPTCMSVAFVLLLLQAIVIFSPESSLTPTSPKPEKVQLHWILHLFGLVSAVCGFGAVYLNKEMNNRKHFVSWHSKFGFATMVGVLCAIIGGLMAKYSLNLRNWIRPINMKLYHATAGMLVFLCAMTTVALATYSNWFHNRFGKTGWVGRICLWAPIILAVCVARQVTQSYLPRILEPRESELDAKARLVQSKIEAKLKKDENAKAKET